MDLLHYSLAPEVCAFSTPRTAVSSSISHVQPYAGFNITDYCGDSPEHVAECRKLLCSRLDIEERNLLLPRQTHTTNVLTVDELFMTLPPKEQAKRMLDVDALVTAGTGICIGVSTADCVPVLLYDVKTRVAAAIHAGWRGMVRHIIRRSIEEMVCSGAHPRHISAAIGPCIGPYSFEVGEEVADAFLAAGFPSGVVRRGFFERPHIDLWASAVYELESSGVALQSIQVSGIDTFTDTERFFSARRLGIRSGRIYSGIMICE